MPEDSKSANPVQTNLIKTRIAPDLTAEMSKTAAAKGDEEKRKVKEQKGEDAFRVIVEFNIKFPGGSTLARLLTLSAYLSAGGKAGPSVRREIESSLNRLRAMQDETYAGLEKKIAEVFSPSDRIRASNSLWTETYAFGSLLRSTINKLAAITFYGKGGKKTEQPLIYKIWLDHQIAANLVESCRTIKSDAARASFEAAGKNIAWAVADTGVDGSHPHFLTHRTLELSDGLQHRDFTGDDDSADTAAGALVDLDGHGTHVAGILAGETAIQSKNISGAAARKAAKKVEITREERTKEDDPQAVKQTLLDPIFGIAPRCKILSLKVLADRVTGNLSELIAALAYIQRLNDNGRNLRVHGVNLSVGYPYNPEWFAAGQSPLCVEVNRLVRSGVVVVAAAGNGGYGTVTTYSGSVERAAHAGTIGDPGNADLAITVGSTHREKPHAYGVSYFSAKGPTADGRMKPDLVAPGERIISCALPGRNDKKNNVAPYREDSGTSMAAPHVSGAIAAFLSVRAEFIGEPEKIKQIFVRSATDLGRRPEYQGAGLIDLMRALQSV